MTPSGDSAPQAGFHWQKHKKRHTAGDSDWSNILEIYCPLLNTPMSQWILVLLYETASPNISVIQNMSERNECCVSSPPCWYSLVLQLTMALMTMQSVSMMMTCLIVYVHQLLLFPLLYLCPPCLNNGIIISSSHRPLIKYL